jgi:bile acid:Na+ symporter, BASS family
MSTGLDTVYAVALIVTLWATAIGLGARHGVGSIGAGLANRARFGRLLVLDVVVVPLVVLALVRLFSVPEGYAVGLLIVGTAAAGPLGFKTAQMARGNGPLAIALVIVLELINIVAMPAWASILVPDAAILPLSEIWRTLVVGVLIPLAVGFSLHRWAPRVAPRIGRWAAPISTVALAVVIVVVLARDGREVVASATAGVLAVAIGTIVTAVGLGWLAGGPDPASRRTAALVSSVRANAVALAVATTAFGATSAATGAIVVFGLCSLVIAPAVAAVLGWRASRPYEAFAPGSNASRSAPTS